VIQNYASLTYNCSQCKGQDLEKADVAIEVGYHGRLSWRLLEGLFRIFVLPVFIIAFHREIHVEAIKISEFMSSE
jgi:hypothetical protein